MELVIATKNSKKLNEIKDLLGDLAVKVLSLADYPGAPEIEEDGESFDENAIKKAEIVSRFSGKLTIADDSGLEVDVLGGAPGVRSARFAGDNVKQKDNNLKLLKLLEGVPLEKRTARFRCSIAIFDARGLIKVVKGSCQGLIGFEFKGEHGFGYDPLFIIPKYNKTFGELGPEIKNKLSHRARALRKARTVILEYLQKYQ